MSEVDQIISPMGHEFELPSTLTVSTFTAARIKEIQFMKKAISTNSATKMAFQKLPKHMRRRAMSHNVKRLPRRVRQIHLGQMKKSGLPPRQKRPSRKYRRRPYNLTNEYARRQRRVKWLETHIWHAKRFHMIEKWGYKLPLRPCDRAFRACYRATAKHCLVQDISYIGCIELNGNKETIINNFKSITDSSTGLTIAGKCFMLGQREGNITVFQPFTSGTRHRKAIGNVTFIWKQSKNECGGTLWLFAHAAFFNDVLETIVSVFKLQPSSIDDDVTKNVCYTDFKGLELKDLRNELVRLRLTGPLSNAVLQNAVKLVYYSDKIEELPKWIQDCNTNTLIQQNNYWSSIRNISSTSQLSPHMILPLIIRDPRFNFPKKRTKSLYETSVTNPSFNDFPKDISSSPLWDESVRKFVKETKISNAKIAEMRSNLLVPGTDLEYKGDPVPIILIQRPGKKSADCLGYASGWDIIAPSAWAQPLWLSLNMWGARSGGVKTTNSINFELSQTHFLYPDTNAGQKEDEECTQRQKGKYFLLPPNKRTNFNKLKICSPFEFNWKLLLNDWRPEGCGQINDFYVLRDKKLLRSLQDVITGRTKFTNDVIQDSKMYSSNYLVPVVVRMLEKGLCGKFSIICLPNEVDLKKPPLESICQDRFSEERKRMRKEHKSLLKKLRKRRKVARRNGKVVPIDKQLSSDFNLKMRKLWLPEATNVRHSCLREIMGFVTKGDFSFLIGQSKAVGFVTMSSLIQLFQLKNRNKVLVRKTHSRQYRVGVMEVIFE